MSDFTTTPILGLFKPTYDADDEQWGLHLNANADTLDQAFSPISGVFLPLTGGTMAGALNATATGGTASRSVQDRAADRINVLDFGAKGDGTTDDYAAICAARDSQPSGSEANLWFPDNHTFYTSAVVQSNGRTLFFDVAPTSTLTGGGGAPFYYAVYGHEWQRQSHWQTYSGPPQGNQAVGPNYQIFNDGTGSGGSAGYGVRTSYTTSAAGANGAFDLLRGDLMTVATPSVAPGSQWMTQWLVLNTPADATNGWGACVAEWNPNNRGPDTGWANARGSLAHWTGGLQVSPGATDSSGAGKLCSSISFGLGVMASGNTNTNGFRVQVYNGLLIEQNAIGPAGRGVYLGGYVAGAGVPTAPPQTAIQIDYTWVNGLDLNAGTFSGNAIRSPGFTVDGSGNLSANAVALPNLSTMSWRYLSQNAVSMSINGSGIWTWTCMGASGPGRALVRMQQSSDTSPLIFDAPIQCNSAAWLSNTVGFNDKPPIAKPTVTGAKGGNAALASLLTALAAYGLVTDSTT